MKMFVTGATGFIGRHLLPLLGGHEVLAMGTRAAEGLPGNVDYLRCGFEEKARWEAAVRAFGPEVCIHLAWKGLPDYSPAMCRDNFDLSMALFEVLAGLRCAKVVCTGTCWEYGDLDGPVAEHQAPASLSPFPAFKTALRITGRSVLEGAGVDFVWGRVFFAYGPGQRSASLIPSCHQALKEGRPPQVRNPGAVNDFAYAGDVAAGILSLAEKPGLRGVFNLGSGEPHTVDEVVKRVAREMGSAVVLPSAPAAPGKGFWSDPAAILAATGWKPAVTLEEGIRRTLAAL